jgi:hypothetical protein
MIGCLFTAELDDKLSAQEKTDVLNKIQKTKGVFSAQFAKAAKNPAIAIHAGMPSIAKDVEKIPGVKSIKHDPVMRM